MEPRLIQTQSQKLILSPQIRQYLRLLQLPLAQLSVAIEQELAENPALEEVPKETAEESPLSSPPDGKPEEERSEKELRFEETLRALDNLDEMLPDPSSREDLSLPEVKELDRQKGYQETLITQKDSLFDYLLWQVGFLEFTEAEQKLAEEIIGNLNDEGYLGTPLEEIAQNCGTSLEEMEKVLLEIQSLDPPGIAARNLQEALTLQLERKSGPEAELALKMVQQHLPLLEKRQWDAIAKRLNVGLEEVQRSARLISHLDPKPGRTFYGEDPIAIKPDASVFYDETDQNKLAVEIYDEELPEIRVSPYYRRLLKNPKMDEASRRFLKERIQAAIDFVKALGERRSTIRCITEEIVKVQPEFFEKGFSHLKPLRLKDVSQSLGIHESTVSRAIQGKYLSTPQGTLPYKSFFSSRLETAQGEAESQKSMMEKIRELIASEDPRKPLSDQALTKLLQEQGFRIARRTVAKYRELLKILPTHLRKQK